ncbi:hypothetical protein [Legionella jordanis]|uniref:hypothetical protein n=1 Tax=Legionella jordanis TaxID=456 RepID=UPI000F82D60D|nr:hypothetical protein [Legionella jordanis]
MKKNHTVFFAGYPGGDRRQTSPRNVNFGIFGALCIVESVSENSIKLVLDEQYVVDSPDKMPIDYKLGGISGAALFSIEESESGITLFSISGVVSEASDTWKIISCIPIHLISDDGKILKKLNP